MLKTLRSRILIVVTGILFVTTLTIIFFVQRQTENILFAGGEKSAQNLLHTVALNVENEYKSILFYKTGALEKRKSELKNIATLALTHINGFYEKQKDGILSEEDAKQLAAEGIKRLRYDNGIGYIWINDTGRPVPRMIMHPTIPELDGKVLDDPKFDCASGVKKNLFQAFVDVCLKDGDGYVDYLWPKPTKDGLGPEQPKLSYVRLFKEWNWVVGTGLYIDDIEQDAQERLGAVLNELKQTFSQVKVAEDGYMFLFTGKKEMLIHPYIEGTDISTRTNPLTGNLILDDLISAAKTPDKPLEYIWDKPPGHKGEFRFLKRSYVTHFKPLDWYIGSSVYNEDLEMPGKIVRKNIILLSIIFFFLAFIFSILLSKNLTTPLRKLTSAAKDIEERGTSSASIPVSGTVETRELGLILDRMIHSIRQAEADLRQSEEKYRALYNDSRDAFLVINPEIGFIDCNAAAFELFGCKDEKEFVSSSLSELSAQYQADNTESSKKAREMVDIAMEKGSHFFEWKHRKMNGELFDATVLLTKMKLGEKTVLQATLRDITKEKHVEKALLESKEKLRSTLTSMDDLVFVLDKDGVFCDYYQPVERPDLYIPSEVFLGKPYRGIMPTHVSHAFDEAIEALISSSRAQQVDYYLEMESKTKWYSAKISMRKDASGRYAGVTVVSRDVTKKKRTEEDLRKERDFSHTLIEASPAFFVAIDATGKTMMMNQAMLSALGYTTDEVIGTDYLTTFIPEADHETISHVFENLAELHEPTWNENNVQTKDGRKLLIEWHGAPIQNDKGELDYFFCVGIDNTERKKFEAEKIQLENRLNQAQKMEAIGTLAGGIAHDFNNILGVIIGYAEMIELFDIPEDSPSRSKLDEIIKAAQRATKLVQQILTFSRQTEHTMKPIQLRPLVKETLKFLRASLPATIEIRQRIESTCTVLANSTQMHQILMNLCTNAGHAMRESGGVLEVGMIDVDLGAQEAEQHVDLEPGPYVRLEVRDTGHGMSSDVMERIFDPYFTTKKLGDGTGLGLSVVHGIVKNHGGAITVDSELGKGTSFIVFLPKLEAEAIEYEATQALPIPSGNERILFVDDEKPLVDIAITVLDGLGYETVGKVGSLEALETFRTEPDRFDLVITDQTMPKMTGIELARELMSIRPDMPVILCTGFSETVTSDKAKAAGIREFINKPLITRHLAENIRKVLDEGI